MKYLPLLLLLCSCGSVEPEAGPVVYHERTAHTSGSVTTVIDRTHEIIKDGRTAVWRLAGTRIVIEGDQIFTSKLDVFHRPLSLIEGTKYHALDTGACLDIQEGDKLIIRLCESDPLRPSIIVEAYP